MSFETVERLKRDYTDKWVTVDTATPELRRFVGLSGQIKTVNMNGRALVQFDNPVDISWYDIDLSYLKVVNAPAPKKAAGHGEGEKKAAPAAAAAKPAAPAAAKPAGGKSPIEIMREAAAAKAAAAAGGGAPAAPPAPAGDKPLSKIEQARLQGAPKAKAAAEATAIAAAAATPAPAAEAPAAPAPAVPAAAPAAVAPMVGEDGKPLSKLEMARRQGAMKKQ